MLVYQANTINKRLQNAADVSPVTGKFTVDVPNFQEEPRFGEMIGTIMCVKMLFSDLLENLRTVLQKQMWNLWWQSQHQIFRIKDSNKAL